MGGESSAEAMVARTEELIERYGFRALKLKGGVLPPKVEFEVIRQLQRRFPESPLRWDPNAAWSVETSMQVLRRLNAENIELEYLEDPTWNLEGMSQVRKVSHIPFATNMCLVAWEQLAPGIRMRSVDIILSDVHFWGGFRQNQRMMAVCDAFQLGVGMHSDRELGSRPPPCFTWPPPHPRSPMPLTATITTRSRDIITQPFQYKNGFLMCPTGLDWVSRSTGTR